MIVNPYRFAAGASAGLPPTAYPGLTHWYDGDNSAHYTGPADNTGSPGNGASFTRSDSVASISRILIDASMVRRIPVVGSASGYDIDTTGFVGGSFYVKPAAGVTYSTPVTLGNLFTASAKTFTVAIKVKSAPAAAANPYDNALILGDANIYFGCFVYGQSGAARFMALNYDGTYDQAVANGPTFGTWAIVSFRHGSGSLRVRVNGGTWSTIASGNTSDMTKNAIMHMYPPSANPLDADTPQFCTYNAARTDAELLEIERYFGAKVGITI